MPDQMQKTPASNYVAQTPEHAHAIARVKTIQRMEGGKETWSHFLEKIQSTRRDPAAHALDVLEQFLLEADPGAETFEVQSTFDEGALLIAKVREGQKFSEIFKQAWINHCLAFGGDVRDPARHTKDFIQTFLATAPGFDTHDDDPRHAAIVEQIKQGQRESDDFKQKWWAHCTTNGEGKNDPRKHSTEFLQSFLLTVGGMGGAMKGGKGARVSPY